MLIENLEKILQTPRGQALKDSRGPALVVDEEGVWHTARLGLYRCNPRGRGEPTQLTLAEAAERNLCVACVGARWEAGTFDMIPGFKLAREEWDLKKQIKQRANITSKTSAAAIQKRAAETKALVELITTRCDTANEDAAAAYKALLEEAKELLKKLQTHGRSDKARADLERKVQQKMVPAKYRDQTFELDSTMMMIGISPGISVGREYGNRGDLVSAITEAYSLRQDGNATVLYAPAYFYSFLVGMLFFKKNERYLVVSASDPGSEEARDSAASLWEPENQSVLACLSKAAQTGNALAS